MQASGFFRPGQSVVHRLHPLTRLTLAMAVGLAAFLLPGLFAPLLLWLLVMLPLAAAAGVFRPLLVASLKTLAPIAISVFLVQGLFYPTPSPTLIPIGPINLRLEGIEFATRISTRLLTLTSATIWVLQTTHPADLVYALTQRGLPQSIGYVLLVSLQLIPYMSGRATAILEAQRSRGLETQGSLLRRLRGIFPLAGPLVIGALSEVEERAIALELRAFMTHGPKSSLRLLYDSAGQRVLRALLLLVSAALLVWSLVRLFGWA